MFKARLVFVHGRAQQGKSEDELKEEWLAALRPALGTRQSILDDVEIKAPFYGNRLAELVDSLGAAAPDDIIVRGDPASIADDYRAFMGEYLEAIRRGEGISDEQVNAEANIPVTERGPQNWPWVLAIIRTLDRIPGLDGDMIERILRDVWIYLERRTVRDDINEIVSPAFDTKLPVVCVAHSLGTVVAFDILKARTDGRVPNLLTLGSPLGLNIVRKALAPIGHPKVVGNWFNARDKRDVVALYPLTPEHFDIDPTVNDYSAVRNRTANAHGISGYLSDPTTVDAIYNALRQAKA